MRKLKFFRFKFMKKYEVDFWGYLTSCPSGKSPIFFKRIFKLFCRKYRYKVWFLRQMFYKPRGIFTYTIAGIMQKKKYIVYRKPYIKRLRTLLKFRYYYGDMTIKKFKRYLQKVNKRRIDFESKLLFLLETRLDILLCRLNFFRDPKESRQGIRNGWIKVNKKIITRINHTIYINDIIEPSSLESINYLRSYLKKDIKTRLFNYPRYMEVNYRMCKCIMILYPKAKDITSVSTWNYGFLRNFM